jgi:magnesium transporter
LEAIEDQVVGRPRPETVAAIHSVKRDLLSIRRVMFPLRETVNAMIRDGGPPITETTRVYLRDCYDHVIHILDLLENYREIAGGLLDMYLSSVSNRMNEIMKVLTIIATIFIPLTFIVGIYGMNFDPDASRWNMPELRSYFGYPAIMLIMAGIAVGQIYYFWRKGWLTSDRHNDKH